MSTDTQEKIEIRGRSSSKQVRIRQKYLPNWLFCGEIDVPDTSDGEKRVLELRFNEPDLDEDSDALDILLRPTTILLIDNRTQPGDKNRHGYEDVHYYACDVTFIKHGHRTFRYDGARKIYLSEKYQFDSNPWKLFHEQDHLSELLTSDAIVLHHTLEENPVVLAMKEKRLWQCPYTN